MIRELLIRKKYIWKNYDDHQNSIDVNGSNGFLLCVHLNLEDWLRCVFMCVCSLVIQLFVLFLDDNGGNVLKISFFLFLAHSFGNIHYKYPIILQFGQGIYDWNHYKKSEWQLSANDNNKT